MRILIVPDSFKGSLTATDFCDVAEHGIRKVIPDADILKMPIADGGEGTMDCILSVLGGYSEKIEVTGAFLGEKRTVRVGFIDDGTAVKTAVIETAEAMGLPSLGERKNPCLTTTFGVGEMIEYALRRGAKKLILTLGGSSTNDCGTGMMAALGAKFYGTDGKLFVPTGGTLSDVASCDFSAMQEKLSGVEIVAMCDVTNPLCGQNGCSAVYAPQKGADACMVKFLDAGCRHFADVVASSTGKDFSEFPGAGAAGGLGFACVACMNGTLRSGIETILGLYNFEAAAGTADYVITGEGRFDEQSLMGKAIGGIVQKTREAAVAVRRGNIPVVVFCGKNAFSGSCGKEAAFPEFSVYEISAGQELEYAMSHAPQNLESSVEKWAQQIVTGQMN
ncbi:MAG: glycerate kinase [Spirochaetaceae bacterium]|nr:glycerate kinase [Spirochaetaceae bacterium]